MTCVVRFALRLGVGNWRPLDEALVGASRVIVVERLPAHGPCPPLSVGAMSV